MTRSILSRREFFSLSAQAARNSIIVLSAPAILTACAQARQSRAEEGQFGVLSNEEVLEFGAIAARIMPSDETPGAEEAGVVYFMDTVLANDRERELATLRAGLNDLQNRVHSDYERGYFYQLSNRQQDALLTRIEQSEFFGTVRFLTIAGMFSLPEYGGNRNYVGYEVIGFDNRHAWAPPFGFYDANKNGGGQ